MTQMGYEGMHVAAASYNLADKLSSRHITSIVSNTNRNLFLLSTDTLKRNNEVHLIDYDEETNKINGLKIFNHPGLVHKVFPSNTNECLFFTSYSEGLEENKISLCSIGKEIPTSNQAGRIEKERINQLFELKLGKSKVHSVIYPNKENKILIGDSSRLVYYDVNESKEISSIFPETPDQEFFLCEADPHHQNLIAAISNTDISLYDIREKKSRFKIENSHVLGVLDVDFNPNKQYCLLSSGEDCLVKFWELRKPNLPMKTLDDFQNWVLSCKYNKYHDQLVLSSCDDGTVNLHRMVSISSAPVLSKMMSPTDSPSKNKEEDCLIKCYDEHEDSVYSISWSSASAWVFASVSYQGNVMVNLVPVAEKYRILL